ncbi:ImmA/IrrE family metallo-endopeptidase [Streptomyces sp. NPDC086080]|uniref:ImmA/IrrE family metallo-endopeptidase n=1 Tax=Streptomyces sp. NPDC086080 TaxID=3365748 RepID=UPI0037CED47A
MSTTPNLAVPAGLHYAPKGILDQHGLRIIHTWLRDTWSRDDHSIAIPSGLSAVQEGCVLAHELEHVWAGDINCRNQIRSTRQERRADLAAARKLIAISGLVEVAQWASDICTAASELMVTERLLEVRLNDLRGEDWLWRRPGGSRIAG